MSTIQGFGVKGPPSGPSGVEKGKPSEGTKFAEVMGVSWGPTITASLIPPLSVGAVGNYHIIRERELRVQDALNRGDARITLPGEFTQDGRSIVQDRTQVDGWFQRQANLKAVYKALYEAIVNDSWDWERIQKDSGTKWNLNKNNSFGLIIDGERNGKIIESVQIRPYRGVVITYTNRQTEEVNLPRGGAIAVYDRERNNLRLVADHVYNLPQYNPFKEQLDEVLVRLVEEVDRVIANSQNQFSTYVVNFTDPRPIKSFPVSFSIADLNYAQHITNYLKNGTPPPIVNSQEIKDIMVAVRDMLTQWLPAFLGYCQNALLNPTKVRDVQVPFTAAADGSLKVIFKTGNTHQQDLSDWAYVNNIWKPAQNRRIQAAQLVLTKLNETPKSYEVANILREIVEAFWRTMFYGRSTMTLPARPGVTSKNINFSDAEGIVVLTQYLSTLNT